MEIRIKFAYMKNFFGRFGLALLGSLFGTTAGLFAGLLGRLPFSLLGLGDDTFGSIVHIIVATIVSGFASLYLVRGILKAPWRRTCVIMRPWFGAATAMLVGLSICAYTIYSFDVFHSWGQLFFCFAGALPAFLICIVVGIWGDFRQRERMPQGSYRIEK